VILIPGHSDRSGLNLTGAQGMIISPKQFFKYTATSSIINTYDIEADVGLQKR
jgi:hypothetical protein